MMQAPKELAKPVTTVRAAPFLSLEAPAGGDDGVPVELAVAPCALGAGELAEGAGGACGAPAGASGGGGVDDDAGGGDDALGAGGDDDAGGGVLRVVVGAEAGGGAEPAGGAGAGGGGDAVVGALGGAGDEDGGGVELAGGGDAGDAGGGAVLGAVAPLPVPLLRVARTMTMSFSLARQLASTPLMKKSGPERSSVTTVSPSSNFFTYDDVLQAL